MPAILKKFVLKEVTSEAAILKLHLTARSSLCDVIPFDLKLAGRRKTCYWLASKCIFSKQLSTSLSSMLSFPSLEQVWLKIIWLKSSHNPEWWLKGLSEGIWTKPLGQNNATEMQPGCWVLFKMTETMSNFCILGEEFHEENLHFKGWNFGDLLSLVQGFY